MQANTTQKLKYMYAMNKGEKSYIEEKDIRC
jgi:hypothetical protein